MLVLVHALEGFGVCRTRVNYDQLSASLNLLKIKVFVSVNTRYLRNCFSTLDKNL
jgi:hypothetical protein